MICVKTGLDWRNLRFKMELIRKKGKQHDNVDVTFRIVSQHTKIGRLVVTYQSVCSYLLFIVMGYAAVNLKLL